MFVDTAKVKLQAGKGGDGAVSFRHEIYIPKGGPDGGDGGKGGSIIFRADKDTNTLLDFRFNPELTAEDGKRGSGQRSAGRSGKDLIVEVPIGTIVYRNYNDSPAGQGGSAKAARSASGASDSRAMIADLTHDGQEAIIAKGGDGGFGNAHFKSSTRQAPLIAEVGEPGEAFEATLELKLIADVGLVGLPNAGKSTFLSRVSNATPEIADYPFTTLTPQLGVATVDKKDILVADIPGLIEGAADGKGLGHDFLRHVDRTAVLLHLIDVYNNDAGEAYRIIRGELERYADLGNRPEVVALTKCEGVDQEITEMQMASILAINPSAEIYCISSASGEGITEVLRALMRYKESNCKKSDSNPVPEGVPQAAAEEEPASARKDGPDERRPEGAGVEALLDDDYSISSSSDFSNYAGSEHWGEKTDLPVIKLGQKSLDKAWKVEKDGEKFIVTGQKIEKFARRTDLANYASVNRLRDIMKKLGIRAELTAQGAEPTSIISIAGKEFTLVEDY